MRSDVLWDCYTAYAVRADGVVLRSHGICESGTLDDRRRRGWPWFASEGATVTDAKATRGAPQGFLAFCVHSDVIREEGESPPEARFAFEASIESPACQGRLGTAVGLRVQQALLKCQCRREREVQAHDSGLVLRRALFRELELVLLSAEDDPKLERTRGAFLAATELAPSILVEFEEVRGLGRGALCFPEELDAGRLPKTTAHLLSLCFKCREPWEGACHVCFVIERRRQLASATAAAAAAAQEKKRKAKADAEAAAVEAKRQAVEAERQAKEQREADKRARRSAQRAEHRKRQKEETRERLASRTDPRDAPGGVNFEVFRPEPRTRPRATAE